MHIQHHLFLFVGLIFMQNKYSCILIWEHLGNSNFCKEGYWRQISNLQKYCQKLFPSVSCEPLKAPWCFICITKSPHVEIKWLKGYCVLSKCTENIPDQSCISNRGTPCIFPVSSLLDSWVKGVILMIHPEESSPVFWQFSVEFIQFHRVGQN